MFSSTVTLISIGVHMGGLSLTSIIVTFTTTVEVNPPSVASTLT